MARGVEGDALEWPTVDDLLDQDRRPDRDRREWRRDQEDGRDVADGGHRDDPALGQLDRHDEDDQHRPADAGTEPQRGKRHPGNRCDEAHRLKAILR